MLNHTHGAVVLVHGGTAVGGGRYTCPQGVVEDVTVVLTEVGLLVLTLTAVELVTATKTVSIQAIGQTLTLEVQVVGHAVDRGPLGLKESGMSVRRLQSKGPVINYGEGATEWENRGSKTFAPPPPPSKTGSNFSRPPLVKGGNILRPPPPLVWLKLQAPVFKLPQNLFCPPFSMAKKNNWPPPLFLQEENLTCSPLLPFFSPPPPRN